MGDLGHRAFWLCGKLLSPGWTAEDVNRIGGRFDTETDVSRKLDLFSDGEVAALVGLGFLGPEQVFRRDTPLAILGGLCTLTPIYCGQGIEATYWAPRKIATSCGLCD